MTLVAGSWEAALKRLGLCRVMAASVMVVIPAALASRAARNVVEEQRNTVRAQAGDDNMGMDSPEH